MVAIPVAGERPDARRATAVGCGRIHPGEPDAELPTALFRRLIAVGDLQPGTPEPPAVEDGPYEARSSEGVRRFQRRHGLEPDGVLGTGRRGAAGSDRRRVRQIELALERLRWLPGLGGGRLIALNIPMFRLWAWDAVRAKGRPSFETDVIVGRASDTRTPVLVEEMRT